MCVGGGGGGTICNKCVYVRDTIPPVFWYSYPNCTPQGVLRGAPQRKRSLTPLVCFGLTPFVCFGLRLPAPIGRSPLVALPLDPFPP